MKCRKAPRIDELSVEMVRAAGERKQWLYLVIKSSVEQEQYPRKVETNRVEAKLREEQYDFRPGRSTIDLKFTVKQLQEHQYGYGKDLQMAFLDIEKVYDSVHGNNMGCIEKQRCDKRNN
ncbi:hypothetical protein PR048_007739 [Dryococelus australis]|uniref:Reverse transcriptase domain-containing protein n=1 Tax=Dryococelus australis TaxID=614101 RepID=A0ABQ9HV37_9NEOP|nr:hypothetical protein PR048_007739 [Dryococelus australis]